MDEVGRATQDAKAEDGMGVKCQLHMSFLSYLARTYLRIKSPPP